jgi:hypothetical protein
MKRWLIIGIPLLILGSLLFLKPPSFTASTHTPGITAGNVKPGVPGGGDEEGKPRYGGHEADEYGETKKK